MADVAGGDRARGGHARLAAAADGAAATFEGVIYDTASISTLHALAAAREAAVADVRARGARGRRSSRALRVYCSEHAHSSIDKAVLLLGLGHAGDPPDSRGRRIPRCARRSLERAIAEDRRDGWRPLAVVATVGTTSTTSVDPVAAIADDLRSAKRVWLHVDAAYAGVMAMVPGLRLDPRAARIAPTRWSSTRTSGSSRRSI